jgi:hypothetical protein
MPAGWHLLLDYYSHVEKRGQLNFNSLSISLVLGSFTHGNMHNARDAEAATHLIHKATKTIMVHPDRQAARLAAVNARIEAGNETKKPSIE